MADLGAYYAASGAGAPASSVKPPAASEAVEKLLAKGNCASCHGEGLDCARSPCVSQNCWPACRLLVCCLKSYQVEGNAKVGRNNAVMGSVAKQFTHAELELLANHVSKMPGTLKVVPQSRFR